MENITETIKVRGKNKIFEDKVVTYEPYLLSLEKFEELQAKSNIGAYMTMDMNSSKIKGQKGQGTEETKQNIDMGKWYEARRKAQVSACRIMWGIENVSPKDISAMDFKVLLKKIEDEDIFGFSDQEEEAEGKKALEEEQNS